MTNQLNQYTTAAQTFRDKYFALPGDMSNAQSFWGVAHATPATCISTVGTGTQTCNGDNNGHIDISAGANEIYRFWQHLTNAGLIEGSYSGTPGAGGAVHSTSTNSPVSKLASGMWFVAWQGPSAGFAGEFFAGDYGNYLEVGLIHANFHPDLQLFKPEEAWNIDTKIDDGKPAVGKVLGRMYPTCTNAASQTDYAASYLLTSTSLGCSLNFLRMF